MARGTREDGNVMTLGMEMAGEDVTDLTATAGDDDAHGMECTRRTAGPALPMKMSRRVEISVQLICCRARMAELLIAVCRKVGATDTEVPNA